MRKLTFIAIALGLLIGAALLQHQYTSAAAAVAVNDYDADGFLDIDDNCPLIPNPSQADSDHDGVGNTCDSEPDGPHDVDGDSRSNFIDNCPLATNFNQTDTDADGMGDACDTTPNAANYDVDNDGDLNSQDNCQVLPNSSQADSDGDGIGDVCDRGWTDIALVSIQISPTVTSVPAGRAVQFSVFGNYSDGTTQDLTASSVWSSSDPTVARVSNATATVGLATGIRAGSVTIQARFGSLASSALLTVTNADTDGDGVPDSADNCPTRPNPGQGDWDHDGIGDACDPPAGKDQCKNGGWMNFIFPRTFKNQGDCVSYTNTGR